MQRDPDDITGRDRVQPGQIRRKARHRWAGRHACPSGLTGRLAARLMSARNASMHRLVVEMLAPSPGDRILEIGFGSGAVIRELARHAHGGLVAGIDPSETMVAQASRRNRRALREGSVDLRLGEVSAIPWPDGFFHKACESSTLHHWPDPRRDLTEVHRVLRVGGLLVLALRMRPPAPGRFTAPGHDEDGVGRIERLVSEAGFREVRRARRKRARKVVCLLAVK